MSDKEAGRMTPLPHDGWRSRKMIIAAIVLSMPLGIATLCLFVTIAGAPVATFQQWVGLVQVLVPSVLVPLFGALGIDKFAQARAVAPRRGP